ncbi:MAG: 3'-5' exonuclease [Gemmatimonadota bacterium]|jgi:DNA polymerase-3 subunit epsilon
MRLPFALDRPLAFIDLETTGLSVTDDRIVELALIRVTPGGDVLERVRRFNPGIPIPAEATAVHGITDRDVASEPRFPARARSLLRLLEGCDLAGFNLRRFDLPLLIAEIERCGLTFDVGDRRIIDVQHVFHREERRDLTAAARFYLGREHPEAHSALGDIRTTAAVLSAMFDRYDHLPRDLGGLHAYCDEYAPFETGLATWFEEQGENLVFKKGKHRGRTLAEVAAAEPDYLVWIVDKADDIPGEVVEACRQALAGR